jgi:hypothetical protein
LLRAVVGALLAVPLSLSGVLAAGTSRAVAQEPQVRVYLDSMTPVVDERTRQVRISGRIVNTGDVALTTVNAMLWFHDTPLTTRQELAAAARERPGERLGLRVDEPWSLVDEVTERLRPGRTASFRVEVPVEDLPFGAAGVYVVGVDVRGTPEFSSSRQTWRARTFLPYVPRGTTMTPVEVSFLLPLTSAPSLVAGDTFTGSDGVTGTTVADGTPNPHEFGTDGRLSRLLELGSDHRLTFVVDPELLAEAERMADGYSTSAGVWIGPDQAADVRRWLNRARGVLAAHHTLFLPYADPDLPTLHQYQLTDRYQRAMDVAADAVRKYRASGTVSWPSGGRADAGMLETIAASGGETVLLNREALPRLPADGSSPVASLATPEGALTALLVDTNLTAGGPAGQSSPVHVQQRFLSETALLAMQAGGGGPTPLRRVVAAFPRNWNPGPSGQTLFRAVESMTWLRPVSAAALLSQAPTAYGGPLARADRQGTLHPSVISELRQLSTTTETMLQLLAEPEASEPALDLGFLRGTSTAWRRDPLQAAHLVETMDGNLQSAISKVSVVPPRLVTLSSQTGRFPVTIYNGGDEPVRVRLQVKPRDPELLDVAPIESVRVDPNRRVTVSVTAAASGKVARQAIQMEARLATPSGIVFGPPVSFPVQVRGYGQVGWVIIGVGLGLMALAAGTRIYRSVHSALRRRRAGGTPVDPAEAGTATEPPTPAEPAPPAATPPGSADLTEQTTSESAPSPSVTLSDDTLTDAEESQARSSGTTRTDRKPTKPTGTHLAGSQPADTARPDPPGGAPRGTAHETSPNGTERPTQTDPAVAPAPSTRDRT